MSLLNQFISFINKENLFSPKDKLLLAVSGGVDSVVLCELCKLAGYDFIIAHCNFKLRGPESERDKEFVLQLANKYKVPFHLNEFDTTFYAASQKISIQEAARELRYHWFNELIQKGEAKYIVTAHHLDDNIETMVMHFFRGTGIYGLRGMLPRQHNIVRPLLFAKKDALKEFAATQQLPFVEDSSNAEDKYTRNFFRNQLLPMVQEVFPRAEQNLAHNLQRFAETEVLYKQALDLHKKKLLEPKGNEVHIPALKLKKVAPLYTITYEIIKDYGFSPLQTGEVIALLDSDSGKYVQSPSHRIIKNRNWLIITPLQSKEADNILVEYTDTQIEFQLGHLILKNANGAIPDSNLVAALDSRDIQFPLLLRKWKPGDYFYPLGMPGKKSWRVFSSIRNYQWQIKKKYGCWNQIRKSSGW